MSTPATLSNGGSLSTPGITIASGGTLSINAGSVLGSTGGLFGGNPVTLNGVGVVDSRGSLTGGNIYVNGALAVQNGGSLAAYNLDVFGLGAATFTNATASVAKDIFIGNATLLATMTITNSTVDFSSELNIGFLGSGSLTLDGSGGSGVTLTPEKLKIGSSGSGALIVENRATMLVTGFADIGYYDAGSAQIQSGGTLDVAYDLTVGKKGDSNGTLTVSVGYVQAENLLVGSYVGATGTFTEEGNRAAVVLSGNAEIGGGGAATVSSGATLQIGGTLDVSGFLGGSGSLTVANSALVTAASLAVHHGGSMTIGSSGSVSVSSAGTVASGGSVVLSFGGVAPNPLISFGGDLDVEADGSVSGNGVIAAPVIDGPGTLIAQNGELSLDGAVGAGASLMIDSGAILDVGQAVQQTVTVAFLAGSGTLDVNASELFQASISDFQAGDQIILHSVIANATSYSGDELTLLNGATPVGGLTVTTPYSTPAFSATASGASTVIQSPSIHP